MKRWLKLSMPEPTQTTENYVVLLREGEINRLRKQLTKARARGEKILAEIRLLERKLQTAEYLMKCGPAIRRAYQERHS